MSKRAKIISVIVTLFWVAMIFLLIRKEYFPDKTNVLKTGYKNVLKDVKKKEINSFTVHYGVKKKVKIGRLISVIEPLLDGTYDISNQLKISIKSEEQKKLENLKQIFALPYINGKSIEAGMQTQCHIGPDYQLKTLDFRFKSNIMNIKLAGTVRTGKLYLKYKQGDESFEKELPIQTNTIVPDGMNIPSKLKDLKKGKKFVYKWFDPVTRGMRETKMEVLGKRFYRWHGERIPVYMLNISTGSIKSAAWVDLSGNLIKYEGFSITLIKERIENPFQEREKKQEQEKNSKKDKNNKTKKNK